jgi:hypothetical protein
MGEEHSCQDDLVSWRVSRSSLLPKDRESLRREGMFGVELHSALPEETPNTPASYKPEVR